MEISLDSFLRTEKIEKLFEMLEEESQSNKLRIILDQHGGGQASVMFELITKVTGSNIQIDICIDQYSASTGALFWMYFHLNKIEGITTSIKGNKALLYYHRPHTIKDNKKTFIDDMKCLSNIEELSETVDFFDKQLVSFFMKYPNFIVFPKENAESRKYPHKEIFDSYYAENKDIVIPIGKFNPITYDDG